MRVRWTEKMVNKIVISPTQGLKKRWGQVLIRDWKVPTFSPPEVGIAMGPILATET